MPGRGIPIGGPIPRPGGGIAPGGGMPCGAIIMGGIPGMPCREGAPGSTSQRRQHQTSSVGHDTRAYAAASITYAPGDEAAE